MIIEQAQPSEFAEIEKVFQNCFADDVRMYAVKRAKHLFVAKDDGQIVGAGGLFVNSLHAKIPKAAIAVEVGYRKRGLGRKIHQTILQSQPAIPLGIDGCCFDDNTSTIAFLKHLKYKPYLDCYIPVIDITIDFPVSERPKNIQMLSFNEAVSRGIEMSSILNFLVENYFESHHWNPVTIPKDSPDWEEIAFWGIDHELSLVVLQDGVLVGASTASVDGDVLQIQWPFGAASDLSGELAILKTLIGQQFKIAKQRGLLKSTFECDSTEEAMFQIPKELKVIESKTWRRFRYTP